MNFPESSSSLVGQVAVPLIERVVELRVASVLSIVTLLTVIVDEERVLEIVHVTVAVASANLLLPSSVSTVTFAILHVGVTPEGEDKVTVVVVAEISASVVPVMVNVYTEFEHEPVFTVVKVIVHEIIVITNKIHTN